MPIKYKQPLPTNPFPKVVQLHVVVKFRVVPMSDISNSLWTELHHPTSKLVSKSNSQFTWLSKVLYTTSLLTVSQEGQFWHRLEKWKIPQTGAWSSCRLINPFTAPAWNISGLKDARKHACKLLKKIYIKIQCYNTSTLNAMPFGENPFGSCLCENEDDNWGSRISDFTLFQVTSWQWRCSASVPDARWVSEWVSESDRSINWKLQVRWPGSKLIWFLS